MSKRVYLSLMSIWGVAIIFIWTSYARAYGGYLDAFNTLYGASSSKLNTCNTCHVNNYQKDIITQLRNGLAITDALKAVETLDSDKDGFTNIEEITARTFPGDPADFPKITTWTASTPAGMNVTVSLKTNLKASVTFSDVLVGGNTTLNLLTQGQTPPPTFQMQGVYYDLSTTASYNGTVNVCFAYDNTGLTPSNEKALHLLHYNMIDSPRHWEDVTVSVNITSHIIRGQVSSFSQFIAAYPLTANYDVDGDGYDVTVDCNDNDPHVHAKQIYYRDADGDGYGDSQVYTSSCDNIPPAGYVNNNLDCDDTNSAINPKTVWYKDADGDGYSDGTTVTQCARPAGYKLASALTATSGDCDDANSAINPKTVWYKDADNDGYSDGTTLTQCARPAGYKLASELTAASGDCNDSDPTIYPGAPELCDGKDHNCNGVINDGCIPSCQKIVWYKDADNDGYSDGTTLTQCTRPASYKLASELTATSGDCDDSNPAINPKTVWYKDADNDGYSDGMTLTQCARPAGYKLASELKATSGDCNDSDPTIYPGAPELCDGKDHNCNGIVNDNCPVASCQKIVWYKDADNDGYSDGTTLTQCNRPAGYKMASELKATRGDCNDNNPRINPATVWYKDADRDGYSDGTTMVGCYSLAAQHKKGYYLASELKATSGDCNDNNPAIHPGARGEDRNCSDHEDDNDHEYERTSPRTINENRN